MNIFQNTFTKNKINSRPPFWFMRQAGRYLPEYRELRASCNGFLGLCYHPQKAMEVTLQPIKRFDMDAAIIFSDILVIPHALGMTLDYIEGEGPKLTPIDTEGQIANLKIDNITDFLHPVYEAIELTRNTLDSNKSLIGFAGAAWTIACYMLQGHGGKDFAVAREKNYSMSHGVEKIIDILQDSIATHLINQINAGADVVQIFDSWASLAPATHREKLIYAPTRHIVQKVKEAHPDVPIIGFPKGLGLLANEYVEKTGVDAIGIDMFGDIKEISQQVGKDIILQGNLDPLLLASSKTGSLEQTKNILEIMQDKPFIFNLGHGMVPHTPIENVEAVCELIKNY